MKRPWRIWTLARSLDEDVFVRGEAVKLDMDLYLSSWALNLQLRFFTLDKALARVDDQSMTYFSPSTDNGVSLFTRTCITTK